MQYNIFNSSKMHRKFGKEKKLIEKRKGDNLISKFTWFPRKIASLYSLLLISLKNLT